MNSSVPAAMSALNTTHSYLGRSSWNGDPNGVETIDEFRLYDGVMAPNQVAADYAAGPSNNIAVFGSLTGLHLSIPSPVDTDQATPLQVTVTADFQNAKGVNLTIANPALKPANTNVLDYVGNLTLRIVGAGATEVVASYGGLSATQSVTVVQSPLTLTHRYSFNESAGSTNFAIRSAARTERCSARRAWTAPGISCCLGAMVETASPMTTMRRCRPT